LGCSDFCAKNRKKKKGKKEGKKKRFQGNTQAGERSKPELTALRNFRSDLLTFTCPVLEKKKREEMEKVQVRVFERSSKGRR